ncbi:group I truncated hemoglobin [Halostella litorea]|uniref:group I truncated hemoglobin n=1 Tax=Halostella litorea TaxID=2528831 RepID=UPI001091EC94|nr:group 1 truncated hemoglobin [Halostella litorea]
MGDDSTLYEDLGGRDAISAVVDEFYDRVLDDEQLVGYFDDTDMDELRDHQTKFLSAVTGGPVDYTGEDMRTAHAGLDLTEEDFARTAEHLDASLAAFDVPEEQREVVLGEVADLKAAILDE